MTHYVYTSKLHPSTLHLSKALDAFVILLYIVYYQSASKFIAFIKVNQAQQIIPADFYQHEKKSQIEY